MYPHFSTRSLHDYRPWIKSQGKLAAPLKGPVQVAIAGASPLFPLLSPRLSLRAPASSHNSLNPRPRSPQPPRSRGAPRRGDPRRALPVPLVRLLRGGGGGRGGRIRGAGWVLLRPEQRGKVRWWRARTRRAALGSGAALCRLLQSGVTCRPAPVPPAPVRPSTRPKRSPLRVETESALSELATLMARRSPSANQPPSRPYAPPCRRVAPHLHL